MEALSSSEASVLTRAHGVTSQKTASSKLPLWKPQILQSINRLDSVARETGTVFHKFCKYTMNILLKEFNAKATGKIFLSKN
jgi:hypothetical protein